MFFFCGSVATGGGNGFASWSCSQLYPGTKASLVLLDCQAPGRSVATFQASLTPHSPVKDLSKFSRLEKTHKKETFISHRRVICWCFWSSMRFMFQVFFFPSFIIGLGHDKTCWSIQPGPACFIWRNRISYHFWWARDWWYRDPIPYASNRPPFKLQETSFL